MNAEIRALFSRVGVDPETLDWEWLERLRAAVEAGNRRMNLTRLTAPADFYLKHVLDSLLPFAAVPLLRASPQRLVAADVGSGAGFPGLLLAKRHPLWDVALIERTQKKAAYLEETAANLELGNVYVVPYDAREAALQARVLRRGCGLVVARAVGRLAAVTEAAAELLGRGGLLVHYKGGDPDPDELDEGQRAARKRGLAQQGPFPYLLPPDMRRSVVVVSRPSGRRRAGAPRRSAATRESRGDREP